ncbi:MAG: hypothetical protein DRI99_04545 [Candidatus Aminicenantes bacterium]|nr:MAG: hypothetical protein DRJ11_11755 [Candidatus Aminicenantes bacterium]RLE03807.1 MAG: hypothetical protein DRI99_04545 [Candidatus Aminicenantes bacterium]
MKVLTLRGINGVVFMTLLVVWIWLLLARFSNLVIFYLYDYGGLPLVGKPRFVSNDGNWLKMVAKKFFD